MQITPTAVLADTML